MVDMFDAEWGPARRLACGRVVPRGVPPAGKRLGRSRDAMKSRNPSL